MTHSSGNGGWGLCMECKWWQVEPNATVAKETVGFCIDENLQSFRLSITGNGGCNRFVQGAPARGSGSSRQPPEAIPSR